MSNRSPLIQGGFVSDWKHTIQLFADRTEDNLNQIRKDGTLNRYQAPQDSSEVITSIRSNAFATKKELEGLILRAHVSEDELRTAIMEAQRVRLATPSASPPKMRAPENHALEAEFSKQLDERFNALSKKFENLDTQKNSAGNACESLFVLSMSKIEDVQKMTSDIRPSLILLEKQVEKMTENSERKLEDLSNTSKEYLEKICHLQSRVEFLSSFRTETGADLRTLSEKIQRCEILAERARSDLEERTQKISTSLQKLQHDIDKLKSEHVSTSGAASGQALERTAEVERLIRRIESKQEQLSATLSHSSTDLSTTRTSVGGLETRVMILESRMVAGHNASGEAQSPLVYRRLDEIERQLRSRGPSGSELEQRMADMEGVIRSLQANQEQLRGPQAGVSNRSSGAPEWADELQQRLTTLEEKVSFGARVSEVKAAVATLRHVLNVAEEDGQGPTAAAPAASGNQLRFLSGIEEEPLQEALEKEEELSELVRTLELKLSGLMATMSNVEPRVIQLEQTVHAQSQLQPLDPMEDLGISMEDLARQVRENEELREQVAELNERFTEELSMRRPSPAKQEPVTRRLSSPGQRDADLSLQIGGIQQILDEHATRLAKVENVETNFIQSLNGLNLRMGKVEQQVQQTQPHGSTEPDAELYSRVEELEGFMDDFGARMTQTEERLTEQAHASSSARRQTGLDEQLGQEIQKSLDELTTRLALVEERMTEQSPTSSTAMKQTGVDEQLGQEIQKSLEDLTTRLTHVEDQLTEQVHASSSAGKQTGLDEQLLQEMQKINEDLNELSARMDDGLERTEKLEWEVFDPDTSTLLKDLNSLRSGMEQLMSQNMERAEADKAVADKTQKDLDTLRNAIGKLELQGEAGVQSDEMTAEDIYKMELNRQLTKMGDDMKSTSKNVQDLRTEVDSLKKQQQQLDKKLSELPAQQLKTAQALPVQQNVKKEEKPQPPSSYPGTGLSDRFNDFDDESGSSRLPSSSGRANALSMVSNQLFESSATPPKLVGAHNPHPGMASAHTNDIYDAVGDDALMGEEEEEGDMGVGASRALRAGENQLSMGSERSASQAAQGTHTPSVNEMRMKFFEGQNKTATALPPVPAGRVEGKASPQESAGVDEDVSEVIDEFEEELRQYGMETDLDESYEGTLRQIAGVSGVKDNNQAKGASQGSKLGGTAYYGNPLGDGGDGSGSDSGFDLGPSSIQEQLFGRQKSSNGGTGTVAEKPLSLGKQPGTSGFPPVVNGARAGAPKPFTSHYTSQDNDFEDDLDELERNFMPQAATTSQPQRPRGRDHYTAAVSMPASRQLPTAAPSTSLFPARQEKTGMLDDEEDRDMSNELIEDDGEFSEFDDDDGFGLDIPDGSNQRGRPLGESTEASPMYDSLMVTEASLQLPRRATRRRPTSSGTSSEAGRDLTEMDSDEEAEDDQRGSQVSLSMFAPSGTRPPAASTDVRYEGTSARHVSFSPFAEEYTFAAASSSDSVVSLTEEQLLAAQSSEVVVYGEGAEYKDVIMAPENQVASSSQAEENQPTASQPPVRRARYKSSNSFKDIDLDNRTPPRCLMRLRVVTADRANASLEQDDVVYIEILGTEYIVCQVLPREAGTFQRAGVDSFSLLCESASLGTIVAMKVWYDTAPGKQPSGKGHWCLERVELELPTTGSRHIFDNTINHNGFIERGVCHAVILKPYRVALDDGEDLKVVREELAAQLAENPALSVPERQQVRTRLEQVSSRIEGLASRARSAVMGSLKAAGRKLTAPAKKSKSGDA